MAHSPDDDRSRIEFIGRQAGVDGESSPADLRDLIDAADADRYQNVLRQALELAQDDESAFFQLLPQFGGLLDADDAEARRAAVTALYELSTARDAGFREVVPELLESLVDGNDTVAERAEMTLYEIGASNPAAIAEATDLLLELSARNEGFVSERGLIPVWAVAHERPERLAPVVPALFDVFRASAGADGGPGTGAEDEGDDAQRGLAVESLQQIAEASPAAFEDTGAQLTRAFRVADDDAVRRTLLELAAAVADNRPSAVAPATDEIAGELAHDALEVRVTAMHVLALVASAAPETVTDAVRSNADIVFEHLDSDSPEARGVAVSLLAYVAETDPNTVEPAAPDLRRLLDDDRNFVRGNAVWALGFVGDAASAARLERLAENDPEQSVREAAREARRLVEDQQ